MDGVEAATSGEQALAGLESAIARLCDDALDWPADAQEQLGTLTRLRICGTRLSACLATMVADAERRGVSQRAAGSSMNVWLTSTGTTSPREASALVLAGRELNSHPGLQEAALAGDINLGQAHGIARTLSSLPSSLSAEQQEEATSLLLARAENMHGEELGRLAQSVLDTVAPASDRLTMGERDQRRLAQQRDRAVRNRSLRYRVDDGSLFFHGQVPILEGEALRRLIEAHASSSRRRGLDHIDPLAELPSRDQRQADALLQIVADAQAPRTTPGVAGDRPRVVVYMQESSLRERAEQAGTLGCGESISAGELRRLCCDADLTPVVLGSGSEILDVGRTDRLVTSPLRRALSARDGGCAFPGCDKPDEHCEAHHIIPWWCGGPTSLDNLVLLCPHHHATVEPARFYPELSDSGSSPPGHAGGVPRHSTRWEVRMAADGFPEFLPPSSRDPHRRPRRQSRTPATALESAG